jgi:hypothetical protein
MDICQAIFTKDRIIFEISVIVTCNDKQDSTDNSITDWDA